MDRLQNIETFVRVAQSQSFAEAARQLRVSPVDIGVNRKKVQRLMRSMGFAGMAPRPNTERPHQALGNQTPQQVHQSGQGGGAMIVDKYSVKDASPVALRCTGSAFDEVNNDNSNVQEIEFKNRGISVQLHCKSSAA